MVHLTRTKLIAIYSLFLCLLIALAGAQSIPQMQPFNTTVGATTSYVLHYFSSKQIKTTTKFTVNFTQSNIKVNSGTANCQVKLMNVPVASPSCSCSSTTKICEIMPNQASGYNTNVQITFGQFVNPYYLSTETISVSIYFSPSVSSENYIITIPNFAYKPMAIQLNSFSQSEYGVGSTPVSYTFNLSLSYISKNFQMQIQIPSELSYSSIQSQLSFYGTVQDIYMMQIQSMLILNIQTQTILNPTGFMLLTLHGFGNPQFIGNSSSFRINFMETSLIQNCASCKIAERVTGLVVESKTPGDISVMSFQSSSLYIASQTNISVNLQLYAGIPTGGKVSIYLPPEISPAIPVSCNNVYGFVLSSGTQPYCTYNQTENRIDTQNFAFPFLVSIGNGILSITLNNPIDTRSVKFYFETFDNEGRMIGKSRQDYFYSAVPLVMSVSATKNTTQVDSSFTLETEITLQRQINSTSNQIQVIFPPGVNYNISNIICMASLQNLGCTAQLDEAQNLVVRMPPPCTSCAVGNIIKFSIINLKNPSYISESTQTIYIHTKSSYGIIEASQTSIELVPSPINLSNYKIPTGQVVGSVYDLQFTMVMPEYLVNNGGKVQLTFNQNTAYCDPNIDQASGAFLSLDQQLQILSNGVSIPNQVQYYTDSDPASINRIILDVCSAASCTSSVQKTFTIKNLRQGYIPSVSNTQNIKITTNLNELISEKSIDMTTSSPILKSAPMSISMSPDMTNTPMQYTIVFSSANIAFGNKLNFEFSPDQSILNSHCELVSNYLVGINYSCTNISANAIEITHDLDPVLMISHNIQYTIVVNSVKAPTSTQSRTYKLSTYFNGSKNQEFTATVAAKNPYPLGVILSKNNNTIGQPCSLTFNITPKTMLYNSYKLFIMKTVLLVAKTDSQASGYVFSQNSTHYILAQNNQMVNNQTIIKAQNVFSTTKSGSITLTTYQSNYQVQSKVIELPQIQPLMLGSSITSTNRTVGELTNLTITVDRNNNGGFGETQIFVQLPANGFSYAGAKYNSVTIDPLNPQISVPVSVTTPRKIQILITNAKNMLYVPQPDSTGLIKKIPEIGISTKKGADETIGTTSLASSIFVANDASDSSLSATRSSDKSGQQTNITINYNTLYGQNGDTLEITLPNGQNSYVTASQCLIGGNPCYIYSSNLTFISIQYVKGQPIVLVNVINYHPNLQKILVNLKTASSQKIQQASGTITPSIALEYLHIESAASSSVVGANNNLQFTITSINSSIEPSQFMKIQFPPNTFSRKLITTECQIIVGANIYSSCQYTFDSTGVWLSSINISSFGPLVISAQQSFKIKLYVTNPWTSYSFSSKAFKFTIYKNETTPVSEGTVSLAEIYSSLSTFSPQPISSTSPTQSTLKANSINTINLGINFLGNLYTGTQVLVMIPKDTYSNLTEIGSTNTSPYTIFFKEDTLYFYAKYAIPTAACPSSICKNYVANLTISVKNNQFVKDTRNRITAYASYDSLAASHIYSQLLQIYQPQLPPNFSLLRSDNYAGNTTTVSINTLLSSNHEEVTLQFGKNILSSIQTITVNQNSQNNPVSFSYTETSVQVIISSYNISQTLRIDIVGQNTLEVPKAGITFPITIRNSSYVLYKKSSVQFTTQLTPFSQGLRLTRSNPTVSQKTPMFLLGDLSGVMQGIDFTSYFIYVNNIKYGTPQALLNIQLNQYTNPSILAAQQIFTCEISNSTHILFKNSSIVVGPALMPIVVLPQSLSFEIDNQTHVNTNINITITFSQVENLTFIRMTSPVFFSQIVDAVGYYQQVPTTLSASIISQNSTAQTLKIIKSTNQQFNADKIILTVQTIGYQKVLTEEGTKTLLEWESPSKTHETSFSLTIVGARMSASVKPGSLRTRNVTDYQIQIKTIAKQGKVIATLPSHFSETLASIDNKLSVYVDANELNLGDSATGFTVTKTSDDNYQIISAVPATSATLKIILEAVPNPESNEPIRFTINQAEKTDLTKIYGHTQVDVMMQELDPIYVHHAQRNTTKIGDNIEIEVIIESPGYQDEIVIWFPQSQVSVDSEECKLWVDGVERSCEPLEGNKIKTINEPGNHSYIFKSLKNSQFSQKPAEEDKISIYMGIQYQKAQTTPQTTVFITPLIVTGSLELFQIQSTNNKRAQYTTLTISVKPQNWDKCDGIMILFSQHAYYVHENLTCVINGKEAAYMMVNRSSLFISVKDLRTSSMVIKIEKLINYFEIGSLQMYTVKQKEEQSRRLLKSVEGLYSEDLFGIIDYLQISSPKIALEVGSPLTRIFASNNYVSTEKKIIIAINDADLPIQLPINTLYYNFGSDFLNCISPQISFNQTLHLQCQFVKAGDADFYVRLYDSKLTAGFLTQFKKTIKIYEEPTSQCTNQMCDLCSQDSQTQYCFVCREGLVSENGVCVQQCPVSQFAYEGVCAECSPSCESCYDFYDNSCLSCVENELLDSGICVDQCSNSESFDYLGFCVEQKQCQNEGAPGCRICSKTGFCYQCLPNYEGEPVCQYQEVLPPIFFIFFMIPLVFLFLGVSVRSCYKYGFDTYPNLFIYLLAVVELFSWIFTVPRLPEQALSMILISFIILRVINSILSYEIFYSRLITHRKQSRLLQNQQQNQNRNNHERESASEPQTEHPDNRKQEKVSEQSEGISNSDQISCKERICRFSAHFLSCDAYELLMSKIGKPYVTFDHQRVFQILNIINRVIIMGFLLYAIMIANVLDLIVVPLMGLVCGSLILLVRVIKSSCCENLLKKIRG